MSHITPGPLTDDEMTNMQPPFTAEEIDLYYTPNCKLTTVDRKKKRALASRVCRYRRVAREKGLSTQLDDMQALLDAERAEKVKLQERVRQLEEALMAQLISANAAAGVASPAAPPQTTASPQPPSPSPMSQVAMLSPAHSTSAMSPAPAVNSALPLAETPALASPQMAGKEVARPRFVELPLPTELRPESLGLGEAMDLPESILYSSAFGSFVHPGPDQQGFTPLSEPALPESTPDFEAMVDQGFELDVDDVFEIDMGTF